MPAKWGEQEIFWGRIKKDPGGREIGLMGKIAVRAFTSTTGDAMAKRSKAKGGSRSTKSDAAYAAEAQVLAVFTEFIEVKNDPEGLVDYCVHCGIPLDVLEAAGNTKRGIAPVILAHYRIGPGLYDLERVGQDFARWPPIAAHIAELQAEKSAIDLGSRA